MPLTSTAACVLGLLQMGPAPGQPGFLQGDAMTGGQVYAAAERSVGRFWNLTRSQVYAELPSLEQAGLIERAGSGGPVVAGAAFAIAWTPCVGPTLGAILGLASTSSGTGRGAALLAFYSLGLALPFLFFAVAFATAQRTFAWVKRHYAAIQVVAGAVLIVMGVLVFTGELFQLNIKAQSLLRDLGLDFYNSV